MTAKILETAMSMAVTLPEPIQERIGQQLLAHIEALEALRADLQAGVDQLDAGQGQTFDIESIIETARREHARK